MKISKLLSLYNLAKSSDSEESKNAMALLQKLLKHAGLTLQELLSSQEDQKVKMFEIKHTDNNEKTIIHHVAASCGIEMQRYIDKRRGKLLLLECTEAFFTDFKQKVDFYIDLFKKDLHHFLTAFVNKHNLFPVGKEAVIVSKEKREKFSQMLGLLTEETFLKSIK